MDRRAYMRATCFRSFIYYQLQLSDLKNAPFLAVSEKKNQEELIFFEVKAKA